MQMKDGIIEFNNTGCCPIDVEAVATCFQDTRKHKSFDKIVADTFISQYNENFTLVNVKNSNIDLKVKINQEQARELIEKLNLVCVSSGVFANAKTWRTAQGQKVVDLLLS